MSKLKIIREALEKNQDIVLFSQERKNFGEGYVDNAHVFDAHAVELIVAPRVGIYSIKDLNSWFERLIPNYQSLIPENYEKFELLDDIIRHGFLRFDEKNLGYVHTLTTQIAHIEDEDFLNGLKGFEDRTNIAIENKKVSLGRRIIITGCPDQLNATKNKDRQFIYTPIKEICQPITD